jgi:hypothetical protein
MNSIFKQQKKRPQVINPIQSNTSSSRSSDYGNITSQKDETYHATELVQINKPTINDVSNKKENILYEVISNTNNMNIGFFEKGEKKLEK